MRAQSRAASPGVTRAGACALLLLTSGCGLLAAEESAPSDPGRTTAPRSAPAVAAPTSSPDEVVAAQLTPIGAKGRPASLRVTVSAPAPGVPDVAVPGGLLSAICSLPEDSAAYATITVVFTDRGPDDKGTHPSSSNLRADLTVQDGGGIGVFGQTEAARASSPAGYCPGADTPATSIGLQTEELGQQSQTITVHAVAPVGPGTRDPFSGATVRIENLRVASNAVSTEPWSWGIDSATAGSTCPEDPDSLCLPLG